MTTVGTTVTGAQVGALGGLAAGNAGMGAGVDWPPARPPAGHCIAHRGPDVVLPSGTNLELVTDRPLVFTPDEIKFDGPMQRSVIRSAPTPEVNQRGTGRGGIGGIGGIGGPF